MKVQHRFSTPHPSAPPSASPAPSRPAVAVSPQRLPLVPPQRTALNGSGFSLREETALRARELHITGADGASSLRTEVLGDGQANCLERAVGLARPGDRLVLLADRQDGVGHAVVQRPDGSVVDPNHPEVRYETLGQWQALNPRYGEPVTASAAEVRQALSVPQGPQRDAELARLGLADVASRRVADEVTQPAPTGVASDTHDAITLNQALEPTELEFERGRLGATLQSGPYAETEVVLEWDPSQPPDAGGARPVTVTFSADVGTQLSGEVSVGPFGVGGGRRSGVTGSQSYTLFLTPEQLAQVAAGTRPLPSLADPLSLQPGEALSIEAGAFRTETGSLSYGPVTLSSEATETQGYSVAVERTSDSRVRVTVGPQHTLENHYGLGLSLGEDASLTLTRENTRTNEQLASVEFDLGTPEGQAAYESFLRTGALPSAEGPGVSGLYHEQTYSYEGALQAGLELGPFSAQAEVWNENSVITRRTQGGVETLTATATLPNGNTISSSFQPAEDGNHRLESLTFTVQDPGQSTPLTMTVRGEEGFQELRRAAAEQLYSAVLETYANTTNQSREQVLAWLEGLGGSHAVLATPPTDPEFSYEAFMAAFEDVRQNDAMPDVPVLTEALMRWQPGSPYMPVFLNSLGNNSTMALLGTSGSMEDPRQFGPGPVPVPSLLDLDLERGGLIDVE